MKRYCLTLDLKNDPQLIAEYETLHRKISPAISASIKAAGIEDMQLFRYENRLMMIMEVNESFTFEKKAEMDAANEHVQAWETMLWKYQQPLPNTRPGEKWMLMENIFKL
ncbi:MAG: L-rhamnose mutarotase [Sphingobacteriaceae bacterium]